MERYSFTGNLTRLFCFCITWTPAGDASRIEGFNELSVAHGVFRIFKWFQKLWSV